MGFGREMADGGNPVAAENIAHRAAVAYVRSDEPVALRKPLLDVGQAFRVSGVGELVEVDYLAGEVGLGQEMTNEIRPDETAAAGHQDASERSWLGVSLHIRSY